MEHDIDWHNACRKHRGNATCPKEQTILYRTKTGINICFQCFDNRQNGIIIIFFFFFFLATEAFCFGFWIRFCSLMVFFFVNPFDCCSNLNRVEHIVGTIRVQPVCCNFNSCRPLSFSSFHHCLT